MPTLHRALWYMGAKARVLEGPLAEVLDREVRPGGTVVDLMSGSGIVAAYCADGRRVFANDSEAYAHAIARSLIEHDEASKARLLDGVSPRDDLGAAYQRNFAALEDLYAAPLAVEAALLRRFADGERDRRWCDGYREFLGQPGSALGVPASGEPGNGTPLYAAAASILSDASIRRYREDPARTPACLVTAYYANVYFGLRQSLQIDSLRQAIREVGGDGDLAERKRAHYLSALLHAASFSTSGTSHFAQPRHLTKDSEVLAMAKRRLSDVFERLEESSRGILETVGSTTFVPGNRAFHGDYRAFIEGPEPAGSGAPGARFRFPAEADLIYMDPPYTADNYSRFYHVLDVIARYDYPILETDGHGRMLRGRYPAIGRRFISGFCSKPGVAMEFRTVVRAAAGAGSKLVISYSHPSGLLLKVWERQSPGSDTVLRLEDLCRESYRDVMTLREPMHHSGQGDKNLAVEELVVVCRDPLCRP